MITDNRCHYPELHSVDCFLQSPSFVNQFENVNHILWKSGSGFQRYRGLEVGFCNFTAFKLLRIILRQWDHIFCSLVIKKTLCFNKKPVISHSTICVNKYRFMCGIHMKQYLCSHSYITIKLKFKIRVIISKYTDPLYVYKVSTNFR